MDTKKNNEQIFVYVGADVCGCVVAISAINDPYADRPNADVKDWRQSIADGLAEWINDGYTIHFVTKEEGCRLLNLDCPHPAAEKSETISDAYAEYLDNLRNNKAPVLELQKQMDLAFEEERYAQA